jgi:hypothetical protein
MTAKQGSFSQHLPAIASAASRKSIFLYVDPYTVKGLIYDEMRAVYERVRLASILLSALRSDNISPICRLPNDAQRERGSACGGRHIVGPRGAQAMSGRAAARRKSFLEKRLLT